MCQRDWIWGLLQCWISTVWDALMWFQEKEKVKVKSSVQSKSLRSGWARTGEMSELATQLRVLTRCRSWRPAQDGIAETGSETRPRKTGFHSHSTLTGQHTNPWVSHEKNLRRFSVQVGKADVDRYRVAWEHRRRFGYTRWVFLRRMGWLVEVVRQPGFVEDYHREMQAVQKNTR